MYDAELLDRSGHPRFRGEISGVKPITLVNSSCGDELLIYLKIEGTRVIDGRWQGAGCAISLASADAFIEDVIGKTLDEATEMSEEFSQMILGRKTEVGKLAAAKCLCSVSRMPARANCAKLAWKSLEKLA